MLLDRLFRRQSFEPADGSAPTLETVATGIAPAMLDNQAATEAATPSSSSRRDRSPGSGEEALNDILMQKLLHAWLQNRHQTLFPLSLNFAVLSANQRDAVVRMLATLLLAGRPHGAALAAAPGLRDWLHGLGGDARTEAAFEAALQAPDPLHVAADRAAAENAAVYAYIAGLAASDARYPASLALLEFLQARFDLPSAMVRSAVRRYRR